MREAELFAIVALGWKKLKSMRKVLDVLSHSCLVFELMI